MERLFIDLKASTVFSDTNVELGRTGQVTVEMDYEKAKVYMTIPLVLEASKFREIADAMAEKPKEAPVRALRV